MAFLLTPFLFLLFSLLPFLTTASALETKPAYFLLAGDSTTATQSSNGGGWGDGFLNYTLLPGSSGRNYGHNGATTKSFRDGGDWDKLLAEAKMKVDGGNYTVYVTIQFGHNDQKSTSGVNVTEYEENLGRFGREVRGVGGIAVNFCLLSF